MNTGEKNTLGRPIYKGPKGGTYVLSAGKKIYKYTKAEAHPPKNTKGRIIYKGPKGGLYVLNGTKKIRKFNASNTNKARTKTSYNSVPAPKSPSTKVTINGFDFVKTNYTYLNGLPVFRKTSTGTYYALHPNGRMMFRTKMATVTNSRGVRKSLESHLAHAKEKVSVPKSHVTSQKLPTPSPRARITTVERNRRLAEIRASLNAIKAKIRIDKPKTRAEIEQRLRVAYWRARARVNPTREDLAGKPVKTLKITMCHAPASVPRKKCTNRVVDVKGVYTGDQPLIKSGGVVALHENDFDMDWFKRQNTYISKLSDYDFWTVQAHTNRSHTWIGPYTYKGTIPRFDSLGGSHHITPLWPQVRKMILNGTFQSTAQWVKDFKASTSEADRYRLYTRNITILPDSVKKDALEMYMKDLKRIIAGAPKAHKKMILYRGSGFDIFHGTRGHWHKLQSFCSAAYYIGHSSIYGRNFSRITVLPGTPVLFVAGTNQWNFAGEYEVMVNIDTHYLIRARNVRRHVYYDGRRQNRAYNPYKVTDVTIAK
jgi:hypothetical protein